MGVGSGQLLSMYRGNTVGPLLVRALPVARNSAGFVGSASEGLSTICSTIVGERLPAAQARVVSRSTLPTRRS